jgi:integrase
MASTDGKGLYQKSKGGVWFVRMAIPKDVQAVFGGKKTLIKTTETKNSALAEKRRDDIFREAKAKISAARKSGALVVQLGAVVDAISTWRAKECAAAAWSVQKPPIDFGAIETTSKAKGLTRAESLAIARSIIGGSIADGKLSLDVDFSRPQKAVQPEIGDDLVGYARAYFKAHPNAVQTTEPSPAITLLHFHLTAAAAAAKATDLSWDQIDGFDKHMDAALVVGGLSMRLPDELRSEARPIFAKAWLEVVEHQEAARRRAALFIAAAERGAAFQAASSPAPYTPRADDKSVKWVVEAYKQQRIEKHGEESTARKYNHMFKLFLDVFGENTIIRTVTPEQAQQVKNKLKRFPVHMGKRFPNMNIDEVLSEIENIDDIKRMSGVTVDNYLANMSAIFVWAQKRDYVNRNPAKGLSDGATAAVERRGFDETELTILFNGLSKERQENHWRFWVPALGLYTGARLNEICQLESGDFAVHDEIPYLRLTTYDQTGAKKASANLKSAASKRNIPLHPALIQAGALDFLKSRPLGRIFPELPKGPNGGYSHDASKWFARHLDNVGLRV